MATHTMPSPDLFFETVTAYQRTAALKAAVELDVFTAIGDGRQTPGDIARACEASERGIRILCDYLTVIGMLTKSGNSYRLTPDSAAFLSKRSPTYLGTTIRFLTTPGVTQNFDDLTGTIRRGTVRPQTNTLAVDNPIWVEFARAMAPMMMPAAQAIADNVGGSPGTAIRVLDIAAGHGMFGITIAQRNPAARIVAVDWPAVLAVAMEHATRAGVQDRLSRLPGDAFGVEFGSGFDVALVTNFLHHFDAATCTSFLQKVAASLKPGGRVAILEFVPNADRVSPPMPASFSLTMLAGTPAGDAYTFEELRQFLGAAGFGRVASHALPTPQTVLIAEKA